MTWRASVLTLFPAMFPGPLGQSLAGRALETGLWALDVTHIRDFAQDRHKTVDDTPFGGGAGMVLRADIVDAAVASVTDDRPVVCLTPRGRQFSQADARRFAGGSGVILLCGRYEGIDQRVIETRNMQEISIGDYVLSGGELAALVSLTASSGCYPASWAPARVRSKKVSRAVCWSILTIPDPPNGRDTACRTCCYRAIMVPLRPGGRRNWSASPASAALIW